MWKTIKYSWKRDQTTWSLFISSLILLIICEIDCGIDWPSWCYTVRDVSIGLLLSIMAAVIFYFVVETLPIYRGRELKLKLLSDELNHFQSLIKEVVGTIGNQDSFRLIMDDKKCLTDRVKNFLCLISPDIVICFESIRNEINILPLKDIELVKEIFLNRGFQRVYHRSYEEALSSKQISEVVIDLNSVLTNVEKLSGNIASYQK